MCIQICLKLKLSYAFNFNIEEKHDLYPAEEDWGGRVVFGLGIKTSLQLYNTILEAECTPCKQTSVQGVLFKMRELVLKHPCGGLY